MTEWFSAERVRVEDLAAAVETDLVDPAVITHATSTELGVPIYDGPTMVTTSQTSDGRRHLFRELATVLMSGAGIVVIRDAVDPTVVDRASVEFDQMIEDERGTDRGSGDHFAKPGANDRVWNALEKLALRAPEVFAAYYEAPALHLAAQAWLGPGYQFTSQVNVVNPGGEAQEPHRDYHLGFMSDAEAEAYPGHVHRLSPTLTLQGAVAHVDMPVESGPTTYLPRSQNYGAGYVAWRNPSVKAYYAAHHVQLPLSKGDAVFFNPAVFHAAGTNRTPDVRRMANLLQISSAFGRAMEAMDRLAMCRALLPVLRCWVAEERAPDAIERVIATVAEAYPFPSNLDLDQRTGGLAPPSQAALIRTALADGWTDDELVAALTTKSDAQRTR
jgi:ectoine hydroxylase-related dioxygenase (phytanoyl-CoA dioxygenase family)